MSEEAEIGQGFEDQRNRNQSIGEKMDPQPQPQPQLGEEPDTKKSETEQHSSDYAPYPKLKFEDITPPPPPPVIQVSGSDNPAATHTPSESNPYISAASAPSSSVMNKLDSVRDTFGKWTKKVGEASKKAEDLAGNVWQHLKTGPSVTDAAMGRIAQSTKVLAEGGYDKIFHQNFETVAEEQLQKYYACYLSTSAGPVMGVVYLSTAKLAFSSDSPLSYKEGDKTEWSYYKVVIPLHQLKAVNTSASQANPAEKYIQIISVDNHEFWFMGFVTYNDAVKHLQEALQSRNLHSV